jgi:hypothetical protein
MTNRIDRQNPSQPLPRRAAGTGPTDAPQQDAGKAGGDTAKMGGDQNADGGVRQASSFGRFLEDQGSTNGCGTTSLGMLMSFWKDQPGAFNRTKIDGSIRYFNLFTSPQNVVSYAEDHGMRVAHQNNAKVEDLTKMLDQGVPVQCLYDPDGNGQDQALHWVVATDYDKDDKGNVTGIKLADPAGGYEHTVPIDEFKKRWDNLEFMGHGTGLNNVMIPMLPKDNVKVQGKDGVTRNSKDIQLPESNGFGWKAGAADKLTDAAALAGKVGHGLEDAGKSVANAGKSVWHAITHL